MDIVDKTIIVTGFKPFAVYPVNSSWQAATALQRKRNDIYIQELTVDFVAAHNEITNLLAKQRCDILLMTGLADYPEIKLEMRARKPVALQHIPGADIYHGSWPWQQNLTDLSRLGYFAGLSTDAGSYVCESVYWSALNFRKEYGYPAHVAFIHVPPLSSYWNKDYIAGALLASVSTAGGNYIL